MLPRTNRRAPIAVIICLALLPAFALAEPGEGPRNIKVGAILALTGDAGNVGNAVRNGMLLAWESLDPDLQKRIEVVFEDDRCESTSSISAFRRLIDREGADVIVNTSSGTGKALASLADQARIPMIAIATDKQVVEGRKYVVNLWTTPEREAQLAVDEALRRGYKRIARISAVHDFNLACRNNFDSAADGRLQLVLDEEYQSSARDFRPFLTKLRGAGPIDAVFVNLFLGQNGLFARQARDLGITAPLFAFELFEDPSEVKSSGGALVHQWYVQADDAEDWFKSRYLQRFSDGLLFGAANGYDALMLIAHALQQAGGAAVRDDINRLLHEVKDYRGALGTYSADGANRFSLPATVKEVTPDGFRKLTAGR